ncbi:MAG: ATP-binding protein [Lysobacteraceae bacterium]
MTTTQRRPAEAAEAAEADTLPAGDWPPAPRRGRFSIRFQLRALFGVLVAVLVVLLLLDAWSQRRTRAALTELREHSLEGVRRVTLVSNAYAVDIVDAVARLRAGRIDWPQAQAGVESAVVEIEQSWRYLVAVERSLAQQRAFGEAAQARVRMDRAVDRLREILASRDMPALARFADAELYPAMGPLTGQLRQLVDLELLRADALVVADVRQARWSGLLRIGISALALLAALLVGRGILRNLYRGVESLLRLTKDTRRRRFDEAPVHRPRGELGEVLDAFIEMRGDIQRHESELRAMLDTNERTRRALQQRDLFQRSLLSAARIAIVALDADGRFTHVNPFAETLLGHPASALVGRQSAGAADADAAPSLLDAAQMQALADEVQTRLSRTVAAGWQALAAMAEAGWPPREFTLLRSDGEPVPVLLAVSAMRDPQGELLGVLNVATDLTEIKALELELRESERQARAASGAKSAFLAAMSHEIRTPMIGVTGMVEVLGHTRLDAEQRRALEVIRQSADMLLQIIGDILDFSKIEAGRLDLAPVPSALRRVVADAAYNFMDAASNKGLRLTLAIDEALAPAHVVDPLRLRQILSNFLSNALKFTRHGGVHVALVRLGEDAGRERVELRVSDTGIGISPAALARLFQPFAQAEADTTRRFGGTGLGLAICRRLAGLMQGEVGMDSREGEGTTVWLRLDLPTARAEDIEDPDDGAALPPPRLAPDIEQAERERSLILLVDDHPTNRQVLTRQLALAGYASETAEDGEQGLARWRSGRHALVLSDIHMPGLDGYAMTRAIRAEEAARGLPRTPVLAITAAAMQGEAERGRAAGMDDFLIKPVGIARLRERLAHWLPHLRLAAPHAADPKQAATAGALPLDTAVLSEATGGDADEIAALLADFLTATEQDMAALRKAAESADLIRLAREAHRIKGAARLVGAAPLSTAAAALESAARRGDAEVCAVAAAALEAAFAQLRDCIAAHPAGQCAGG